MEKRLLVSMLLIAIAVSISGCGGGKAKSKTAKDGSYAKRTKDRAGRQRSSDMSAEESAMQYMKMMEGMKKSNGYTPPATSPANERYARTEENRYEAARREPLSTFSIDVDTASYTNIRRQLRDGYWPRPEAVRIEEMINYFRYRYPQPEADNPFSVTMDRAICPWNKSHELIRIGLQGRQLASKDRPNSNLVFLLDVSGSMDSPDKLPLVKDAMRMLVSRLTRRDRVAIVVYAGGSGLILPSTAADRVDEIFGAMGKLRARGSTNGGDGIRLAYRIAEQNRIPGGVNRVILCTDGDFNVGTTADEGLVSLAKRKAKSGVTLSVLGFGRGNLNDSMMEKISNEANGTYHYIDTLNEARRILVEETTATLVTIAKDVKIQVDFNPAYVKEYRLIGYSNRMLRTDEFKDDTKDAGDIGAGHQVTALYEVVPPGRPGFGTAADPSEFQKQPERPAGKRNEKTLVVRLRWKHPEGSKSREVRYPMMHANATSLRDATVDMRFSAAVAAWGLVLSDSKFRGSADLDMVQQLARSALGKDEYGYREEFVTLNRRALELEHLQRRR